MFKRLLHATSVQDRLPASTEDLNSGLSTPSPNERPRTESSPKTATLKLPRFEEIYRTSSFKATPVSTDYHILKVADMLCSDQIRGLSPPAKHGALMMALEAAGVAVEDVLQDAVQRQRALNECEEEYRHRLHDLEAAKLEESERLASEMETMCIQYRSRMAAVAAEIDHERSELRQWQEAKAREHRRIAEAAAACVPCDDTMSSEASVTRMIEKNSNALRQRA
jgi:hypothetical protein